MREFETTFAKGLKKGLREDEDNPRNEEALVECLNTKPSEEGLIPIVPVTTPMTVSMAWPFPQVFDRPLADVPEWVEYLDDTYWQDIPGGGLTTWEDTYWNVLWWGTHAWGDIEEIGTWASGFRPTKFRVTFECTGGITELQLYLQTVDDDVICEDLNYTSGTELDCDFSAGKDIDYFSHTFAEASEYTAHITNIEFYEG